MPRRKADGRRSGAAVADFRNKTRAAMRAMTRKSKIKPKHPSSKIKRTVRPRRVPQKSV